MPETVDFIARYARAIAAPVRTETNVTSVRPAGEGYLVATNRGDWICRTVVLAAGACNIATVPPLAAGVPSSVESLTPKDYRNPDQLRPGGVLVVGASATGIQLAEEIQRSGRQVTLSVGEHVRVPRVYRGKDIQWWMAAAGILDERYDAIDDIGRARNVPSLQLIGSPERRTLDLNGLSRMGVSMVGRLAGMRDDRAQFSGSLRNVCALADLKMTRLLDALDEWSAANGVDDQVAAPERFDATFVEASPPLAVDLGRGGIETIIWATGFRPDTSWLHVPALDRKGNVLHDGGVVAAPGIYLMGMPFLRRRKSSLIDGAADDARDLADHLSCYLDGGLATAAE
jgi:putative flavoprotein involved in K+ transport